MFVSNTTCCSIEKEIKNSISEKTKQFMMKKKKKNKREWFDTGDIYAETLSQSDFFQSRTHKYAPQSYVVFYAETQFIKNVHEKTQWPAIA